jgi:hypothetical protein
MDHLQAGIECSFAVFPKFSTFFHPCEGLLDDPSLGHDGEVVQLVAFGDLHGGAELLLDRLGKRFAGAAATDEHAGDLLEIPNEVDSRRRPELA